MFSSKRKAQAAAAAQARQEAALRRAGLGISSSLANRKEHDRTTSASTTASRATGFVSPPLASPIFGIPPPPSTSPAPRQWDGKLHRRNESNSTSTTATYDKVLGSPSLGLTFDFELPPSPALSTGDALGTDTFFRPSTSDGANVLRGEEAGRKSSVTAPALQSASRASNRIDDYDSEEEDELLAPSKTRLRQVDEPAQRVHQVPKASNGPPPLIQPTRTAWEREKFISAPSHQSPPPPQQSLSPPVQRPPRQSSLTPPKEKDNPLAQLPAPSRIPPLSTPKHIPAPIPIPPPPSIPPPQVPASRDRERDQTDSFSTHSTKSKRSRIKSFFFDRPNPDFLSQGRPSSSGGPPKMPSSPTDMRPSTSAGEVPKMESSLFPKKETSLPRQDSLPVMNRAWLDARDKPYQNLTPKAGPTRPHYLQQTHSTPNLLAAASSLPAGRSAHTPGSIAANRSPLATFASADQSPQGPQLTFARPSFGKSSLSAESEVSPIPTIATPTMGSPTVGTPYQETSPSFPLPQHVTTRPKTAGGASTMGGVSVPTHYTSSGVPSRPETSSGGKTGKEEKSDKKDKRKTRLLNPMNLLSRRKSGEVEEAAQKERAAQVAQAQALQKQKSVAVAGVNRIPENYDPRIRGKVVHDFSVPRHGRGSGSYSGEGPEPAWNAVARGLQSSQSAPFMPAVPKDGRESQASGSGSGRHLSVSTSATSSSGPDSRRSRYTTGMGVFHEHLSETPDRGSRISSLQAEKRENKDFLQRVSHLSSESQESGVLPPFARRSHTTDPMQASHVHDFETSGRTTEQGGKIPAFNVWKDNRDSGVSAMSGVSPITARTSSAVGGNETHFSFSPVSPTSPGGPRLGNDVPTSAISPPTSEGRPPSSYFSTGMGSKSSQQAVSPFDDQGKSASPARSPGEAVKVDSTPTLKKKKSKGFSIKIPFSGRTPPELPPRGASAASGKSSMSPISSPTSRSVKSMKSGRSAKSGRSGKSGRSLAGTPSLHSLPSNQPTPEPQVAEPAIIINAPKSPKLVEKLATAVGHGKRSGNKKDKLEHQMSNASRFSFQFGGSAAEELALEEKARKMRANGDRVVSPVRDEDDEDFFDEDAMDDMDEMEMQANDQEPMPDSGNYTVNYVGGKPLTLQEQVLLLQAQQAQQAQQPTEDQSDVVGTTGGPSRASQFMYRTAAPNRISMKPSPKLQLDIQENDSGVSEDDGDGDDDEESGYWDNDDFMGGYSEPHTREPSVSTAINASPIVARPGSASLPLGNASAGNSPPQPRRQRGASAASAHGLTLNTNVGPSSNVAPPNVRAAAANFVQDSLGQPARSGFYMQPVAAGYSPTAATAVNGQAQPPALPTRDSGNSERNRVVSGLAFESANDGTAGHKAALSNSTIGSNASVGGSSSSGPRTTSTGLGLSGFSEFKFTDSAPPSRPLSLEKVMQSTDRRSGDSETIPRDVNWTGVGKNSPLKQHERNSSGWTSGGNSVQQNGASSRQGLNGPAPGKPHYLDITDDDVYFDDGGFDLDLAEGSNMRGSVDESAFDDDGFDFDRINGVGHAVQPPNSGTEPSGHHRDISGLTITSLRSDGPYPSFAMPNPAKARQRDSTLLLEDLPLQEYPVDPKLIPRRNPSEDARRLGLSANAPPLPAQPGSLDAAQRVTANLQAYHSALAAAANKAAEDGKFLRMPSVSTMSVHSQGDAGSEDRSFVVSRDASHYSRNEDGEVSSQANGVTNLDRNESVETSHSKMDHDLDYSPPKMTFDFGFEDDLDDLTIDDDDIVAAANAEALASDDEGFYGQEFGFYAKARPNSGEVEALIGGYFGEDGDDGLTRNKSIKEPNLTPITERSEFSTRNSFIGMGALGPSSAGPMSAGSLTSLSPALARLPYSPLVDGEVTSFDQLRKLRAHAFGGSNASLQSGNRNSNESLIVASDSPTWSTRSSAAAQGYFGPLGGAPMTLGYSTDSSASSNPSSAHPQQQQQQLAVHPGLYDSPHSATSSGQLPFSEHDVTPKRPVRDSGEAPLTARKVPAPGMKVAGHSRKSSKDSVTYVQEQDPAGTGQPRWVLERRRTSEQGQMELVGREFVQGGWI